MAYSSERNHQILIGLLKHHGVKKIVASPGANNVSFISSIQNDDYFEIYSCIDERSAAYMACGMCAETGEIVALSCTGATASRNYLPGLTEAFYRHLPVLAITSTMPIGRIGHNYPQSIDRTNVINDVARMSVYAHLVKDAEDEWDVSVKINAALLELTNNIHGPVHINLETLQGGTFDVKELSNIRPIDRITAKSKAPNVFGKVAIFVGAHLKWSDALTRAVDLFCEKYDAVVWVDHTSNYRGKYGCLGGLISAQVLNESENLKIDTLIHIGDVSGAYLRLMPKQVWRVSCDGKVCDTFKALRYVFQMDELEFFELYNTCQTSKKGTGYYEKCKTEYHMLNSRIKELPFSNIYVAREVAKYLPHNTVMHFGILNSLRSWNFVEAPTIIEGYSNTGGFGIDGCISSLIGGALVCPDKMHFGVVGDLAFFYDMNSLGNRHVTSNIRILVVNNGRGQEFKNYKHRASQFGKDTDVYIAAAGHYGDKSPNLIKNYATDLGFKYLYADDKESLKNALKAFCDENLKNCPMVLEVFTETEAETEALKIISNLEVNLAMGAKEAVKSALGGQKLSKLKHILKG